MTWLAQYTVMVELNNLEHEARLEEVRDAEVRIQHPLECDFKCISLGSDVPVL
jgi:hypothetical protein